MAVITAYFLISFANIYGNALTKQDEYLDFRAKMLLKDLGQTIPQNANVMISVGELKDNHPVTQRFMDKYGDISRLIPKTFMSTHLSSGYDSSIGKGEFCRGIKGEVIFKNAYHTIERAKLCYIVRIR